jgi:SAM-dependent methyltransferase
MPQNIYDDPEFFEGYSRLPRSLAGLDGAPEWPALRALIRDLRGFKVVDLGCGYGWFCRWAAQQGAARVLGIDISEKMLAHARAATTAATVSYVRADMERLGLPEGAFELVYSSLALHYVADLGGLIATVHRALVPGGNLIFSVEHPIFTAPRQPGWSVAADGRKTWPVDGYLIEGPRQTDWLTTGVIKQHRTLASYVNLLLQLGFSLSHIEEWGPSGEQIAARPALADERQRPPFLIVTARK